MDQELKNILHTIHNEQMIIDMILINAELCRLGKINLDKDIYIEALKEHKKNIMELMSSQQNQSL